MYGMTIRHSTASGGAARLPQGAWAGSAAGASRKLEVLTRPAMSTSGRVLVVEDQELERKSLTQLLKREGFHVFGAENADKAIGYVDENMDVVLSDLHMGDVSGLDLLSLWKQKQP